MQNYTSWSNYMAPEKCSCIGLEYFCNKDDQFWSHSNEDLKTRLKQVDDDLIREQGLSSDAEINLEKVRKERNKLEQQGDLFPEETSLSPCIILISKTGPDLRSPLFISFPSAFELPPSFFVVFFANLPPRTFSESFHAFIGTSDFKSGKSV